MGSRETDESDRLDLTGLEVLVAEDDADGREMVERILEARHATVTAVTSATEAIASFRRRRPDVLVSDIAMPGMDGYQLLAEIRRIEDARGLVWTPALALTALAGTADMRQAGVAGFQRHLAKPFDPSRLVRDVAELAGVRPRPRTP